MIVSVGGINEIIFCGREVMRLLGGSFRRFKWSVVGKSIVV